MLVIISCIFAFIFVFVFAIVLQSESDLIKHVIALITFLSIMVCAVTFILSVKYTNEIELSDEVKSSQNIVNIKDNRDLQGGFFIGCGEVKLLLQN